MRSLSSEAASLLATPRGIEPITVVQIDWTGGKPKSYADRTIGTIPAKIIEIADLDDAANLGGSGGSGEVSLTLDDTDGTIKAILDAVDVHKKTARVYQYLTDFATDQTASFLLFSGVLMSPITWNERDRTVKLSIVSQLEDQECGESTTESIQGVFSDVIPNQAWPLIFGSVRDNKAVQLRPPVSGVTVTPVGVLGGAELMINAPDDPGADFLLSVYKTNSQLDFLQYLINVFDAAEASILGKATVNEADRAIAANYGSIRDGYGQQYTSLETELIRKICDWRAQQQLTKNKRQVAVDRARLQGYGTNPLEIVGGHNFPQGPVVANIGGATFNGVMNGNYLTIHSRSSDYLEQVAQGILNANTNDPSNDPEPVQYTRPTQDGGYETVTLYGSDQGAISETWQWTASVPDGRGGFVNYTTPPESVTITRNETFYNTQPILQHQWIEAGANVQIYSALPAEYAVSATPGTVTSVKAICTVAGVQLLREVPSYTVEVRDGKTVVILPRILSTIANEQWGDDIYVSFTSTVGPKIPDILKYIIQTYSDLTCDEASFSITLPYEANFAINSTRNVLSVIQDIAFQACCAVRVVSRVVYLTYLRPRPDAVDSIDDGDIDAEFGVEVSLTSTEDLVTKMTVNWSELPVPRLEAIHEKVWTGGVYADRVVSGNDAGQLNHPSYTLVLRNNVDKYGVHEATYNFTIYNNETAVADCAAFWLRRKSNTWKRISFTTPLHKLALEAFDAVSLSFSQPYAASEPVLAIVESAVYDSANNCIHFTCTTPVLAGTTTDCGFFWS